MIANLIGGFISILIGVSLIGPIAVETNKVAGPCGMTIGSITYGTYAGGVCTNGTQTTNTTVTALYGSGTWASTVLQLVPGFFALGILGIGIAVTYSSLRQAGIV